MDARTLLTFIHSFLDTHHGMANFDSQPPRFDPRRVGAFGGYLTDRYTQPMMIEGESFFVTVEKDPNQDPSSLKEAP